MFVRGLLRQLRGGLNHHGRLQGGPVHGVRSRRELVHVFVQDTHDGAVVLFTQNELGTVRSMKRNGTLNSLVYKMGKARCVQHVDCFSFLCCSVSREKIMRKKTVT